jgi:Rrf2 family transcriptional regulator, iron-sulfur cluster assembly transcription factor
MQMTLGSRGDYSVRATLDLARHYGSGRRKAREIAAQMQIPQKFLPQVLGVLVHAGIVDSTAGPGGGYTLARAPENVSLLEVVEAAEGPIRNQKCLLRGGPCHWEEACSLHYAWAEAQEALIDKLATTTFAELAASERALETST